MHYTTAVGRGWGDDGGLRRCVDGSSEWDAVDDNVDVQHLHAGEHCDLSAWFIGDGFGGQLYLLESSPLLSAGFPQSDVL